MTKSESLPFVGQEFQNRYRWFINQKPTCYPSYLIGIAESQNSSAGFSYVPPILFGDKAKARLILNVANINGAVVPKNFAVRNFTN